MTEKLGVLGLNHTIRAIYVKFAKMDQSAASRPRYRWQDRRVEAMVGSDTPLAVALSGRSALRAS